MTRYIVVFVLAVFAVGLSGALFWPSGTEQQAMAQSKPKLKTCRSKLPSGKIKTWRCKANQPCCVNHTMSIYVCGSPIIGCF